jgi:penicillin-binding protein 1B
VGNDDYSNVELTGAVLAAPIWADFMKRAIRLPQYSDMTSFSVPDGIHQYRIDRATNQLADETCPNDAFAAAYLDGTQPQGTCSRMTDDMQTLGNRIFNPAAPPYDPNNPEPPESQTADPN